MEWAAIVGAVIAACIGGLVAVSKRWGSAKAGEDYEETKKREQQEIVEKLLDPFPSTRERRRAALRELHQRLRERG